MTHHEESEGITSASKFEIVALCEGQPQLEAVLRSKNLIHETNDEYSSLGTAIHKARETGDTSQLTEEGLEIYNRGMENERRILEQWMDDLVIVEAPPCHKETRMWIHWPDGTKATSAKLDVYYVWDSPDFVTHILVVEWKTLWCSNLTPAERNYQGMVQAVCAYREYGATSIRVAFNKAMFGASDAVDYSEEDLKRAEARIFQHLWAAKQPGATTNAGAWCRHCVCQPHCPSAASMSLLPSVMANVTKGVSKADVGAAVARLGPADWKFIHERASVIRNILDSATKCLKGLSADDLKALGLQIGEGRRLDPITNVVGAYKALEHSITPELLWGCLSFEKGKIVEAVMVSKGMTKKEAQMWVKETLAPFITEERASGSLEEFTPPAP